jgi:pimeloyl-ACP methyl ester carboxylesterase
MHLLLLPGMDGTGLLFAPLLPFLPPSVTTTVVAYPPDRAYGYTELLPHVKAAIPSGREFLVLGESFSGPLALLLAAGKPAGLRGIILCASFARSPLPSIVRWFQGLIRSWLFQAVPRWMVRRVLLGRFATPFIEQMVHCAIAVVRPAVLAARVRAILEVDVGAQLRVCSTPILYLAATEDRLVSQRSLAYIRRVQPRVEVVNFVGPHLLLQTVPEQPARVIEKFAAACESRSPPE